MYLFKNKYKFNITAFREHASVSLRTGITSQVGISRLNHRGNGMYQITDTHWLLYLF